MGDSERCSDRKHHSGKQHDVFAFVETTQFVNAFISEAIAGPGNASKFRIPP